MDKSLQAVDRVFKALADQITEVLGHAIPERVAGHAAHAGLLGGQFEGASFARIERDGLFHEHVLAGLDAGQCGRRQHMVGRSDQQGVNFALTK